MSETSKVIKDRWQKLEELEANGVEAYPNRLPRPEKISAITLVYGDYANEELEGLKQEFLVAGRIIGLRRFGKAAFFHIKDESGKIQVHARKDLLGEAYKLFKKFDIGDIVQVKGPLFRTKTGELTISCTEIRLVTKNLRPLPEKYHGLKDKELRYRQRYVDLIVNEEVKETFRKRAKIIQVVRHYFLSNGFLEVETPMMQPIVGGATARPFVTHHNALGIDLYLRIAPELYLKRLLVGGFEKVFELNRNFRNEGISLQHNPEFTMLEFYEAYSTYEDLIVRTEELFSLIAKELYCKTKIEYQGQEIDLTPPWKRLTLKDSLIEVGGLSEEELNDKEALMNRLEALGAPKKEGEPLGKLWTKLFDLLVEPKLIQPTFITHYPTDVSPLARRNQDDPSVTDRFELFIAGREMANAFSELNDPRDQKARFEEQVANRGDDEEIPPEVDYDYIRALEVGMPPAAGEGIGIDRLVMLFTNSPSIRDVILFPQLRPEHS
ncbi:Lysyl-tRNA synthetase (class II) [Dissulfuribacter thermophilus]|uniref:Lysine--tRNA ligase n=1 Tax=Dissulfuribacter thermophilus TaxID=1156395 RepID=A0A1B9F3C3_9BACT|nr:lysine--tRNA ligase [Dissulfuribacter thermophilus]OCC14437.1 Lysyl-tRNA synthetase (class II) [Dissulfuribacter thermophilus]